MCKSLDQLDAHQSPFEKQRHSTLNARKRAMENSLKVVHSCQQIRAIDIEKFREHVTTHVVRLEGPIALWPCYGGLANVTYRVICGPVEFILRHPPPGRWAKGLYDLRREYSILSALHGHYELAPVPYHYCDDATVIGSPFSLTQVRQGIVLHGQSDTPELAPPTVRRLHESFVCSLANLHRLDCSLLPLGRLARPDGYVSRCIDRAASHFSDHSIAPIVPGAARIREWLTDHLPAPSAPCLLHNDYKFANVVVDLADLGTLSGVIDWELGAVGDALTDLGLTLSHWGEPSDPEHMMSFASGPTAVPGGLTRREVVDLYAEKAGARPRDMTFYYVLGLYRRAAIYHHFHGRQVRGEVNNPRFAVIDRVVANLILTALDTAVRGEMP
ncbi:MAG TPA: phosphotransferase family protein [Pirellulaceae bacterium]